MNDYSPELQVQQATRQIIDRGRASEGETRRDVALTPIVTSILSVVLRRRWVIGSIIALALLAGILVTFLMTPMFTAATTIDIRRENSGLVDLDQNGGAAAAAIDQEFYETQYGLLRARAMAQRIVEALRLQDNAQFFDSFDAGQDWFADGRVVPGAADRGTRIEAASDILLAHMSLDYERSSRLVDLMFTSPDPMLSKQVADAWARQFIEFTQDQRFEASAFARQYLENRLDQLRQRIDESERRVVDYAARQNLVNLPGTGASSEQGSQPERSLTADNLATFNQQLASATAARIEAESRLNGNAGSSSSEALNNSTLAALRQTRAQAAAEYAKMMAQFEPAYPPARALNDQVRELDRAIAREEARVRNSVQQNVQAARERENELRAQVESAAGNVLDNRRRSIQYNIYLRDADTNRQLYDALLQRYKEIGVAGGVGENNISIVDTAERPGSPSSPILWINLLLALIAGVVIGGAVAWILEQLDQGIVDPSEVEGDLGVPLLGTVPTSSDEEDLRDVLMDRKSTLSEAYTSVQTSLSFATDHGVPDTLAVTSTRSAEGKSTTSYALALALARSGRKVLLVDADMRSPSVHEELGIANREGFSNYLSGSSELAPLVRKGPVDGFDALTAGPNPPSAPDLLSSDRFGALATEALRIYDHVIFDSPPVMGLADAPIISSKVEGTVYVLEAHGTQKRMSQIAMNRLRDAKANLVGAVLTKFDARKANFGYGYSYGYGYGYGDAADQDTSGPARA